MKIRFIISSSSQCSAQGQVRSRPGSMNFFQSVKILSMTSFGREVRPQVPCRRFAARKAWALLILQPFIVTSHTSQLILQHFRRFTYVTAHSPTFILLHLRNSSFSNPSSASPTLLALHLRHLASRPCGVYSLLFRVVSEMAPTLS